MKWTGPTQPRRLLATFEGCVVVGHRGACGRAPENTEDSFRLAAVLAADAVETDIRRCRDGALVLIHDATVDRTTNGTGAVRELDLAAIQALDAGAWFGTDFAGERIMTLDEGLTLFRNLNLKTVLELKEQETSEEVASVIRRHGMAGATHIVSFQPDAIAALKAVAPEITATLILDPRTDIFRTAAPNKEIAALVAACGAEGVGLYHTVAGQALVESLHGAGIAVSALVVNRRPEIVKALRLGVEGVITDFPDRVRQVMDEAEPRSEG